MAEERDYSIIFKCLEESKAQDNYSWEVIQQTAEISPEIEKLREIVADTEQCAFSILTTT